MTALTPEQLRVLASDMDSKGHNWSGRPAHDFFDAASALRASADLLEAVRAEVIRYAGWHEQSPEDSWRFERDLRTALGMEQYSGDDDD